VLAVVATPQHTLVCVKLVGDGGPVDLHAGSEHNQLEPLGHHREEEVYMRSFVDEESDGVAIYRHFQDEVWRCARLDCWPDNAVVVGVDESLV